MSPPQIGIGLDTAWMSLTTHLMFLMQLGFAFLEAGSVRYKNINPILLKNVIDTCVVTVSWYIIGYCFAFGDSVGGMIGMQTELIVYSSIDREQNYLNNYYTHILFQWTFACNSITIFSGSLAERISAETYIILCLILASVIYPIQTHWIWAQQGFLNQMGFHDLAGVSVVHTIGGIWGFYGAFFLQPRKFRFQPELVTNEIDKFKPGSVSFIVLGTLILWFGWYGFNCGSVNSPSTDQQSILVGIVAVNTTLSSVGGGLSALIFSYFYLKEQNTNSCLIRLCSGCLSGLVSITGCADIVSTWMSVIVGVVGGIIYCLLSLVLVKYKIDDPLDASPIHAGCGLWGIVASGLLHSSKGLFYGSTEIVGIQFIGAAIFIGFNSITAILTYKIFQFFNILELTQQQLKYQEQITITQNPLQKKDKILNQEQTVQIQVENDGTVIKRNSIKDNKL